MGYESVRQDFEFIVRQSVRHGALSEEEATEIIGRFVLWETDIQLMHEDEVRDEHTRLLEQNGLD